MKEYIKIEIKSFTIGILVYFILNIISWLYWSILTWTEVVKINFNETLGAQTWNNHPLLIISTLISVLILFMPGFLTGWFSKKNPTLNGAIVVFVCATIKFFVSYVNWTNFYFNFSEFYHLFRPWLESLILPVAAGAVCGAAGQYYYIRKNELISPHWT